MKATTPRHHGSVYLVTLITVAAISSMVLVGVRLRSAANAKSNYIEQMSEGNNGLLDATEYALQHIDRDADWVATAQTGTIFPQSKISNSIYTGTVTDADTSALPTDSTSTYRLKLRATNDTSTSTATLDVLYAAVDYPSVISPLGALGYWPLNEAKGDATAVDKLTIGNGTYLDPSIAGASTNDEGGVVPTFNYSNDQIQVPFTREFSEWQGTYSLWIKSTEATAFKSYGIIGSRHTDTGQPNLMFTIFSGGLHAYVGDSATYSSIKVASSASGIVKLNTWHHVALTFGPAGLTIYLDGVQVAKNTGNTSGIGSEAPRWGGQQPFNIGASYISFLGSVSEVGFKGSIGHVVYHWDKQLTADEVADLAAVKPDLSAFEIVEDTWVRVFE